MRNRLLAITGPTCGGKTTLKERLLEGREDLFRGVTTTTTRRPRIGEKDGSDYRFVTEAQFRRLISEEELLEWVLVDSNYYGIERRCVAEACLGRMHGVIVVNPSALEPIEEWCNDNRVKLVRVFASAPLDELRRRLAKRKAIAEESEILQRSARLEIEARDWQRSVSYDLYAGINHNEAVQQALRAIL